MTFRFAGAAAQVCKHCNFVVARTDRNLVAVGRMADLVDIPTPLQLNVTGRWNGEPFVVDGRVQLGGGLLVVAGAMTRIAALAFALFCALTAALFHWNFAVHNELLHFEKDLAIAGGFLVLAAAGPGRWSWDQWRSGLAD